MQHYQFQELKEKKLSDNILSYLYCFTVEDILTKSPMEYCIEFHCVKGHLFIPRMYPRVWEGKDFCFKKLLSSDGHLLNVRRILQTLMVIYDTYWGNCENNYLIASGNYNFNERNSGPSKKVVVYKHYFEKSDFAKKYYFFALTDITYIIMNNPTIPKFYKACQLFAIYNDERLILEGNLL